MFEHFKPVEHSSHTSCFLDDFVYAENRTIPSRSMSRLSYSSCGSCSTVGPRGCSSYLQGLDDSEAEDEHCQQYPIYPSHPGRCSQTSLDSLNSTIPPSQVSDVNFIVGCVYGFHFSIFLHSISYTSQTCEIQDFPASGPIAQ